MSIDTSIEMCEGIKFSKTFDGKVVGRATLYVLRNDYTETPYGLLSDLFIDEDFRRQGFGSELVKRVLEEAKSKNCHKLILTSRYSRPHVHNMYLSLGFSDYGKEFRMDL